MRAKHGCRLRSKLLIHEFLVALGAKIILLLRLNTSASNILKSLSQYR